MHINTGLPISSDGENTPTGISSCIIDKDCNVTSSVGGQNTVHPISVIMAWWSLQLYGESASK